MKWTERLFERELRCNNSVITCNYNVMHWYQVLVRGAAAGRSEV